MDHKCCVELPARQTLVDVTTDILNICSGVTDTCLCYKTCRIIYAHDPPRRFSRDTAPTAYAAANVDHRVIRLDPMPENILGKRLTAVMKRISIYGRASFVREPPKQP